MSNVQIVPAGAASDNQIGLQGVGSGVIMTYGGGGFGTTA